MEVEILGHRAKVERITGQTKLYPWFVREQLVVWLSLEEAVGNTLSFTVHLPAKKYANRAELSYNIRRRGEETLTRILKSDKQEAAKAQNESERQKALAALAAEAWKLVE